MKIQFIALTDEASEKLLKWGRSSKNRKDCTIIQENPAIVEEIFKDSVISWMLKETSKRLKVDQNLITTDPLYKNSVKSKFLKTASRKLKIHKNQIEIRVIK